MKATASTVSRWPLVSQHWTTLQLGPALPRGRGTRIFAAAAHRLFTGQAPSLLADPLFEGVAVTETLRSISAAAAQLPANTVLFDSTKLVADAIMVAHAGR